MSLWVRLISRRRLMMENLDQDIRDFVERETQDSVDVYQTRNGNGYYELSYPDYVSTAITTTLFQIWQRNTRPRRLV